MRCHTEGVTESSLHSATYRTSSMYDASSARTYRTSMMYDAPSARSRIIKCKVNNNIYKGV